MTEPAVLGVEPMLDVNDVAQLLRLTPKSVYHMVEMGRLPHVKVGSRVRFTRDQVRTFIDANAREIAR